MSDPTATTCPAPLRFGDLLRLFSATLWRFGGQMTALTFLAITALVCGLNLIVWFLLVLALFPF